jgi:hypothetical protein
VFKSQRGQLVEDPIEGELPRPRSPTNGTEPCLASPRKRFHGGVSGPRANPYRTGHGRPLESSDNSSTRNPQFATRSMGVAETSPSVPRRDGEGTYKQVGELALIASNGPRLGCSTHSYTSWKCTEHIRMSNTCAWHRRGRLEYCRCRLKLTSRTPADSAKKHCRSKTLLQGFGG